MFSVALAVSELDLPLLLREVREENCVEGEAVIPLDLSRPE